MFFLGDGSAVEGSVAHELAGAEARKLTHRSMIQDKDTVRPAVLAVPLIVESRVGGTGKLELLILRLELTPMREFLKFPSLVLFSYKASSVRGV